GYQWRVIGAERLLAHAAIADRNVGELARDAEADRPALAAAGMDVAHRFTSQTVIRSPVSRSLPSLSWMPFSERSSRILSASAKFLAFSISRRICTSASTAEATASSISVFFGRMPSRAALAAKAESFCGSALAACAR